MSFRTLVAEMETSWVDRLRWTESVFFWRTLEILQKIWEVLRRRPILN